MEQCRSRGRDRERGREGGREREGGRQTDRQTETGYVCVCECLCVANARTKRACKGCMCQCAQSGNDTRTEARPVVVQPPSLTMGGSRETVHVGDESVTAETEERQEQHTTKAISVSQAKREEREREREREREGDVYTDTNTRTFTPTHPHTHESTPAKSRRIFDTPVSSAVVNTSPVVALMSTNADGTVAW